MRRFLVVFALLSTALAMSAKEAFPPTPAGTSELKTLPAGVLLQSSGRGNYFDGADNLFGPLFRYISKHNIAMTTPVEARVDSAAMFFWVAESERSKVAGNDANGCSAEAGCYETCGAETGNADTVVNSAEGSIRLGHRD